MEDLKAEVQKYLNGGEISNPIFQELKRKINRRTEKLGNAISDEFVRGKGEELEKLGLWELLFDVPSNFQQIIALKNKLKKVTIKHPFVDALQKIYDDNEELIEMMKELKTKIKTTAQKREEVKVVNDLVKHQRYHDTAPMVKELEKFIEEYVDEAERVGKMHYDNIMKKLDEAEWNIDIIVPKPNNRMSTGAYRAANNYRAFIMSLVSHKHDDPFVKEDLVKKVHYIDMIKDQARGDYLAWINKMTEKVGKPVQFAEVRGNPWSYSVLTVTTADGEEQVWHTQMIINTSKFGKLFNQFPTTRKK